jgi:hypothetical protein
MPSRPTSTPPRTSRIWSDWWLIPAGVLLFGMTALGAMRAVFPLG